MTGMKYRLGLYLDKYSIHYCGSTNIIIVQAFRKHTQYLANIAKYMH